MNTQILMRRGASGPRTVLVGALLVMFAAMPAQAAAVGATDVDITLPDIVILHYFTDVDVTLTSAALGNFLTGSPGDQTYSEGVAGPPAGGLTQDLAIGPSALTGGNPAAAVLTLTNAWAVRAISLAGGTNTEVAITNTDATLDHTSTAATITITGVAVDDGTSNGATISFTAPGLTTPTVGDVELTLNLTGAINAGVYENGEYTLTATNI